MLIVFCFILSAVAVSCESVDQDGPRKSRQLDLGLQDIGVATTAQQPFTQKEDIINGGYLPPVSSALTPEVVSAQSQLAIDVSSADSGEKESDLCKPPYDHESCNSKGSSESESKIPKPSRDLMPPFLDVKQKLKNKAMALLEPAKEETETSTQSRTPATTQKPTPKPGTKIFKPLSTQNFTKIITPTARSTTRLKPKANAVEATNELRSYLPPQPEISAAAQTNVAVVQQANQNDQDHDHHRGHLHRENFNICDDAFHAFLCVPLKARKRITGAFPTGLLASSSYINYQKSLPNPERDFASSNNFPPQPSPTNFIQSTYLPPFTTKIQTPATFTTTSTTTSPLLYSPSKIIPQTSNPDERFHFPPLPDNRISNSSLVNPAPSIQSFTAVKPSTIQISSTFSSSRKTDSEVVQTSSPSTVPPKTTILDSLSPNENVFYSYSSPSIPFFPSTSVISTIPPITSTFVPLPSVTNFAPLLSNSIFVPQEAKIFPELPAFTTSMAAEKIKLLPTTLSPSVQVSSFPLQSSISSNAYLPPKSELPAQSKTISTTLRPTTFNFAQQSSNADRANLPRDPKEPAAAQISEVTTSAPKVQNPFHHGRDLCTDPFHSFLCSSAKPRKRITGQRPPGFNPESSNANELRVKPEPSNESESRVKPFERELAQHVGYTYPRPSTPFSIPTTVITTSAPTSTGYVYPTPDKIFPLSSEQKIEIARELPSTTKKPEPTLRPSAGKVVTGYQYPKPDKVFLSPAGQSNIKVTTTTILPSTGYYYQKPLKQFPLPTEQEEARQKPKPKTTNSPQPTLSLPTNTIRGYQYPRPEQSFKLPENKGYWYLKPDKQLELPTESRSKKLTQSSSNLDTLGNLGSADFIPVNKVDFKRAESSKLLAGLRKFGERMKKRERELQFYRKPSR